MVNTKKLDYAFIGAGSMASAIFAGMIKQGTIPSSIIASTYTTKSAVRLATKYNVATTQNNNDCLSAEVIVLAVKPQILTDVLSQLDKTKINDKLFISVIAGIPCQRYEAILGDNIRLIRTMPNTPSLVGEGMTGLYANRNASTADKTLATQMMQSVGQTLWVENEAGIDYVNAISGSGPAYFYTFIKHLARAGEKLGLDYQDALTLAIQTAKGTAILTEQQTDGSPASIQALIDQVTSKGGTTYEAINAFADDNLDKVVENAVNACYKRALALGK